MIGLGKLEEDIKSRKQNLFYNEIFLLWWRVCIKYVHWGVLCVCVCGGGERMLLVCFQYVCECILVCVCPHLRAQSSLLLIIDGTNQR